jgi:predicted O-methyltransferase YrrM
MNYPAPASSGPDVLVNLKALMAEIETAAPGGGSWCSLEKAITLSAIIVGIRPKIVVELGVWMGGSAIPMAIALRRLGVGQLIAIDSWSAEASTSGQEADHLKWWGEIGAEGHERALKTFIGRLEKHGITSERCTVVRKRSDEADVPASIDLLHHDANHGPQAVADIERWAPSVRVGGLLVIDDLHWPGNHVRRARARALELGFVELYPLGTGCVLQRLHSGQGVVAP